MQAGQLDDALTAVMDALALVQQTGEDHFAAELYRLQGELLLARAGYRLEVASINATASSGVAVTV